LIISKLHVLDVFKDLCIDWLYMLAILIWHPNRSFVVPERYLTIIATFSTT